MVGCAESFTCALKLLDCMSYRLMERTLISAHRYLFMYRACVPQLMVQPFSSCVGRGGLLARVADLPILSSISAHSLVKNHQPASDSQKSMHSQVASGQLDKHCKRKRYRSKDGVGDSILDNITWRLQPSGSRSVIWFRL